MNLLGSGGVLELSVSRWALETGFDMRMSPTRSLQLESL